jgi:hypothetical protein
MRNQVVKLSDEEIRLAKELEAEEAELEKAEKEPAREEREEPDFENERRIDPTPLWDTHEPANAGANLKALKEAREEIIQKFEDGEISAADYADHMERVDDLRNDIKLKQRFARMAVEENEAAKDSAWWSAVDMFMTGPGRAINTDAKRIAFDQYVQKVTGDYSNSHLSNRAQLALAKKMFDRDFAGSNFSAGADYAPASRSGGRADFAALDRLADSDPAAFEKRIASMSEEAREAYLER